MKKVTYIKKIHNGLYAHICPLCGSVLASSSDKDLMPEYSVCNCDEENVLPNFELITKGDNIIIRRNSYPRFSGIVTMGLFSDIENVIWIDTPSVTEAARAMREAADFLVKNQY